MENINFNKEIDRNLKTLSISELEEVLPHQVAQNLYYFLQEMDEKK